VDGPPETKPKHADVIATAERDEPRSGWAGVGEVRGVRAIEPDGAPGSGGHAGVHVPPEV